MPLDLGSDPGVANASAGDGKSIAVDYLPGDAVLVLRNGVIGTVVGVWFGENAQAPSYSVRYADRNGFISERYLLAAELAAAAV